MIITWYGQSCFKIQSGELVLAIDPFAKETGLTPPRFRTDVALVTHMHKDHANTDSLTGNPFIVKNAGEYEIKGIYIHGIETFHDNVSGKERGMNTMYAITMEEINLLHMGDFGEEQMRDLTLEELGDIDILMIPIGGTFTIDAEKAAHIIKQIEPKIVIPMHYKIPGLIYKLEGIETFLKETGTKKDMEEKLTIKKKDIIEERKTEFVILKSV
ncbi:MAG: MBL fold metallo-hydrolase [Candidatus Portnoybacteria bacterium]|nr:MBL fold metallo-hydrolase [Candidatus Portnoybacteria bacterium]